MLFFTADTHFGHRNIIEFCKRPFAIGDEDAVTEMRESLLNGINCKVGKKDELYVIGDFGLHLKDDDVKALVGRIVCNNVHLVLGNHDSHRHGNYFKTVSYATVVKWNHQRFYLSHYPLKVWREHFQLHGHEHGTMKPEVGQLDVGVDGPCNAQGHKEAWRGEPWSVEEVVEYVQRRDRAIVADACRERHGRRLIVGGYGTRDDAGNAS